MPFAVGDEVVVSTLRKKRGVVVEADGRGRYRVQVAGVMLRCAEHELAAATPVKTGTTRPAAASAFASRERGPAPGARIDLHGMRVEEAMTAVIAAIDRALQRGAAGMEIVHGKGSGRVRAALHRQLRELTVVKRFALDPGNDGVTQVWF